MSFNLANLESKLSQITETQDSITSTSQWILFHKRHATESANAWSKYTVSCPENLKLGLIYVANEVVQQAKIKNRLEILDAWSAVMPKTFSEVYSRVPSQIQDRITRVVNVWRDRRVFKPEVLKEIEAACGSSNSFFSAPQKAPSASAVPNELSGLVSAWGNIQPFKIPNVGTPTTSTEINSAKTVVESSLKTAKSQMDVLSAIEMQISNLKDIVSSRKETLEHSIQKLNDSLINFNASVNPDEEPSPEIEADSEPEIYTANKAQDNESDDDEQEAKRSKVDLDPKLMSFLASMK